MKKILAVLLISIVFLIFGADLAQAQLCEPCAPEGAVTDGLTCKDGKWRGCPVTPGVIQICNPIQACDFGELVYKLITFIFWIALSLFPLMMVIAGIYFVTAAGNPAQVEKAKGIIVYSFIGFIVIISAMGLIELLKQIL